MPTNANVFSSAGQRRVIPVSLPDGATVQQALEMAGETVPANCDIFMGGEPVTLASVIPAGGLANITINQKTKGNLLAQVFGWLMAPLR